MVVDDEIVRARGTHAGQVVVVEPQGELVDRPEGRGVRIDRERASETLRVGGAPVVEVERDGGEDPPALVDLGQPEMLELATTVGRSAGPEDALERDAVPGGADEPPLDRKSVV